MNFVHFLCDQKKQKLEKKKWREMRANSTYIYQSHAGTLETLNDFRLGRIRNGGFSDESEGRVTGPSAGSDDEFSDVSSAADDENLALFGHCEFFRPISGKKCGLGKG